MASKGFVKEYRAACVVPGLCCGPEWIPGPSPVRLFDPFSAIQTNSSLLVSPLIWSFTSPHLNFLLSSRARKPKRSDKSHRTVLCITSASWSPNSPRSNIKPSSASVKERAACGGFPFSQNRVITTSFLRKGPLGTRKTAGLKGY